MNTVTLDPLAAKPKKEVLQHMVVSLTNQARGSQSLYYAVACYGEYRMTVRVSDHYSASTSHFHTLFSQKPARITEDEIKEHAYEYLKEKYYNNIFNDFSHDDNHRRARRKPKV